MSYLCLRTLPSETRVWALSPELGDVTHYSSRLLFYSLPARPVGLHVHREEPLLAAVGGGCPLLQDAWDYRLLGSAAWATRTT